jgi:hypothetical protein
MQHRLSQGNHLRLFPLEFNNEAHSRGAEIKRNIGVKGMIPRNDPF